MVNYKITNSKEASEWLFQRAVLNEYKCVGIQNPPQDWMEYDDGSKIVNAINYGWLCVHTGEKFMFEIRRV